MVCLLYEVCLCLYSKERSHSAIKLLRNTWAWRGLDTGGSQVSCMEIAVGKPSAVEIWYT